MIRERFSVAISNLRGLISGQRTHQSFYPLRVFLDVVSSVYIRSYNAIIIVKGLIQRYFIVRIKRLRPRLEAMR